MQERSGNYIRTALVPNGLGCFLLGLGREYKPLAENDLGEKVMATRRLPATCSISAAAGTCSQWHKERGNKQRRWQSDCSPERQGEKHGYIVSDGDADNAGE